MAHDHHNHDHQHGDHQHGDHQHGDHQHGGHQHGNPRDRELKAIFRYLKIAPRMWRSEVNDAVVDLIDPRPGETVIDIGAGMGPGVMRAAASGAEVLAIDPTPFMRTVMSGRRWFSRRRKPIRVLDGAVEALPAGDHEVDALWSVNTMHHWSSVADGAVEIARVLAPGGRIVLVDEDFSDPRHPNSEEWHKRHGEDSHHGFSMVDASEMGDLMTGAGLVDVVAEQRDMAGRPVIAVTARGPN